MLFLVSKWFVVFEVWFGVWFFYCIIWCLSLILEGEIYFVEGVWVLNDFDVLECIVVGVKVSLCGLMRVSVIFGFGWWYVVLLFLKFVCVYLDVEV